MTTAVLSIGSNLGDRLAMLRSAVTALRPHLIATSGLWQTPPWGPVPQQDYYNAVLIVRDEHADAREWLQRAQACEDAAGRARDVRWGPRTLDVDVITVDAVTSADPALQLPHPRARERAFVLIPWQEADPEAVLPGHGSVADLIAALPSGERVGPHRIADASWAA